MLVNKTKQTKITLTPTPEIYRISQYNIRQYSINIKTDIENVNVMIMKINLKRG